MELKFEVKNNDGTEINYDDLSCEDWTTDLILCDIDGWAITENGSLILIDECGNFAYAPEERFTVEILC